MRKYIIALIVLTLGVISFAADFRAEIGDDTYLNKLDGGDDNYSTETTCFIFDDATEPGRQVAALLFPFPDSLSGRTANSCTLMVDPGAGSATIEVVVYGILRDVTIGNTTWQRYGGSGADTNWTTDGCWGSGTDRTANPLSDTLTRADTLSDGRLHINITGLDSTIYGFLIKPVSNSHQWNSFHIGAYDGTEPCSVYVDYSDAGCDAPPDLETASADSIRSDYTAENDSLYIQFDFPDTAMSAGYAVYRYSTSAYQDSSSDTNHVTFSQNATHRDTITVNGTEEYTLYVSAWLYDSGEDCWSSRVEFSTTLSPGDTQSPDQLDLFSILKIVHINADSVELAVGAVDSADYTNLIIRGDTAAIPTTITSGWSVFTGSAPEDDTSLYLAGALDTLGWMLYLSAFTQDEVPNSSAALSDSIYFPRGGGETTGGGNNRLDYLIGLQR